MTRDKKYDSTPKGEKTTVRSHSRKTKTGMTVVAEHLRRIGKGGENYMGGWTTKAPNGKRLVYGSKGEHLSLIVEPKDRIDALVDEIEWDEPFAGNISGRVVLQNDDWMVAEFRIIDIEPNTQVGDLQSMQFQLEHGIDDAFGNTYHLDYKLSPRMDEMTVMIAARNDWSSSTNTRRKQNMDKVMNKYRK